MINIYQESPGLVSLHLIIFFQASPDTMENKLENGLIIGHAYSITDVAQVSF